MKFAATIMTGLLAVTPVTSSAFFDPPYITPAIPQAGEMIYVNIYGGECDALETRPGFPQITQEGNSIRMLLASVHEDLIEWCIFGVGTATYPLSAYPAGAYTLQVDRTYDTFFGPVVETIGVVSFEVEGGDAAVQSVPTISPFFLLFMGVIIAAFGALELTRMR